MTLYQFILLDEEAQAEALWARGVMVADRQEDSYRFILYQVDGFYVEVQYCTERNQIERVTPFKSTERLWPYLEQINLSAL